MSHIDDLINSPLKNQPWATSAPLGSLQPQQPLTPTPGTTRPIAGIRCPLPPLNTVNPDNVRTLSQPGVRSVRVLSPKVPVSTNQT